MRLVAVSMILVLSAGGVALAQGAPGAKASAARHENFKQLGGAFKAINDELKKDAPDKAVLTTNAARVKALAGQLPAWFPKGSGVEADPKSRAKAEVWTDAAGFSAAVKALQTETGKLQAVAGDDTAAVKAQVRAVGGACKGCHDNYRAPEKS